MKSCVLLLKVAVVGGMDRHRLRKTSFLKCFLSRLKRKASGFKFLRFEERSQKAPLSSVEGRLKLGNKALFFNSLKRDPLSLHCLQEIHCHSEFS